MGKISINYNEVYTKTAELRQAIEAELADMDAAYRRVQSSLDGLDSHTNAECMEAMIINQRKSYAVAETLHKLLSFMDSSAKLVEQDEMKIRNIFDSSVVVKDVSVVRFG